MMKSMYHRIGIDIHFRWTLFLITVKDGILNFENPGNKKLLVSEIKIHIYSLKLYSFYKTT